jgi:serine/threonine-protein kinase
MLLKLIARGGMGDVYLATTTGIEGAERPCIVKTVRRDHVHDGSFLARFLDEARVQSQLNHPGVAQILEASTDDSGEPFTVVEYIEGRALSDVRQRAAQIGEPIGWPEAVSIALEIAQALAHVHERAGADGAPLSIVHRDLSPQNVMASYGGEVKIIDFGTARGQNRRCHTVAGVVFAKPGYVAPEVARHEVGDGRIDLYALGVILWETIAGRRFFSGEAQQHLEDVAHARQSVAPIAAEAHAPRLLDEVIAKLTANQPDQRYPTAARAAQDIARLLSLAPTGPCGERGVRARIASLMKRLWPREPARARAEFARLVAEAREMRPEGHTPAAGPIFDLVAARSAPGDPAVLAGTPYRIGKKIGEGTSGAVYEAEHVELGRQVAIKVLAPEHATATDAIDRFRREARAVARLAHPNIVALYDFGRSLDGRVYLVMERLVGETLDQQLARKPKADWRACLRIAIAVTHALEAAHGASLVHRDLKPANLFVTKAGPIKLLDFGVAMALADTTFEKSAGAKQTRGFAIFGTPEYMAPEQCSGDLVDGRCDLYALGCVLYELSTGRKPFEGASGVLVMSKQIRESIVAPRVRAPEIPKGLDQLILRALAKRPADRFENAAKMREAMQQLLDTDALRPRRVARIGALAMGTLVLTSALTFAMNGAASRAAAPVAQAQTAAPPVVLAAVERPVDVADTASFAPPALAIRPAEAATVQSESVVPRRASTKAARGDAKRALVLARAHARSHPRDVPALRSLAQAAYRAGDLREARRAGEAWCRLDPSLPPRLLLSSALDAAGRPEKARWIIEEYARAHPDAVDAKQALARVRRAAAMTAGVQR